MPTARQSGSCIILARGSVTAVASGLAGAAEDGNHSNGVGPLGHGLPGARAARAPGLPLFQRVTHQSVRTPTLPPPPPPPGPASACNVPRVVIHVDQRGGVAAPLGAGLAGLPACVLMASNQ